MWQALLGNVVGGAANAVLAHNQNIRTRKHQEQMMKQQMGFQERMSNTAFQRGVADAKKAGLHPWLVAGGQGASSPSGSMATPAQATPSIEMPDIFTAGISIKKLEQVDKQLDIMDKKAVSDIAKNLSEEELNQMKKIMLQRNRPMAEAGGAAGQILHEMIKLLKSRATKQFQPGPVEIGTPK